MKKLLTIAMMAGAMSAMAVESSNTFGILRVDSTAAQTIVSIPWEAAGGGAIKVKDVVKTANLTPASGEYIGDQLYYYDTTAETPAYKMWHLTSTGWEGAQTVIASGTDVQQQVSAGSDSDVLSRGGAIILVRQNPTTGTPAVAKPFYLYGQYNSALPEISVTRNASNGTYTLIAPPSADSVALNSGNWTGVTAGDHIILPSGQPLYWKDATDKWCTLTTDLNTGDETYTSYTTPIPAGEGVWMCVAKGSGTVSVQW
ncbi:MAG: hypothetical protein MJ109_03885 [Kiritimatiellae bacterium]|nr:hypothetical protein [Kiritimatiellia bacterium]